MHPSHTQSEGRGRHPPPGALEASLLRHSQDTLGKVHCPPHLPAVESSTWRHLQRLSASPLTFSLLGYPQKKGSMRLKNAIRQQRLHCPFMGDLSTHSSTQKKPGFHLSPPESKCCTDSSHPFKMLELVKTLFQSNEHHR